jgi:hypothetical protein
MSAGCGAQPRALAGPDRAQLTAGSGHHDIGGFLLLATVLRASTDVVICTIPYRLNTR